MGGLLTKRGRGEGVLGKMALSSSSRRLEQGRVQEGAAAMGAGSPGREGGRGVGENGEEAKGISFPSSPWAAVE